MKVSLFVLSVYLLGATGKPSASDNDNEYDRQFNCCTNIQSLCTRACNNNDCTLPCSGRCGSFNTLCGPWTCSSLTSTCKSTPANTPSSPQTPITVGKAYTDAGIVPTFVATAPEQTMWVTWPSGLTLTSANQTVDTADIKWTAPEVKFSGDPNSLYTIMIVDFGVVDGDNNFIHWMVSNAPGGDVSRGDTNIEYLPPWAFERNEANNAIVDTGDAALHPDGVLAFKQSGRITVEENFSGCNQMAIFGRALDVSSLQSKYSLTGPVAGNLFWTYYNAAADELNCYMTKCTGAPFPFPIPGVTDQPECQS